MKKLFALVALVGMMASCNNKKDEKKDTTTSDTTVTTTPNSTDAPPTTTTPTSSETPKFSDPDVQAYADSYAAYVETYRKAAESKDMTKMAELGKMGQDLASKSAAMTQKLTANPEEAKKLADFITAKSAEITEYAKKMSGM